MDTKDPELMPAIIKVVPVILFLAGLVYLKWRLSPPKDVIGTYLEDTDARAEQLIRASREQHYRETWHRSDPS